MFSCVGRDHEMGGSTSSSSCQMPKRCIVSDLILIRKMPKGVLWKVEDYNSNFTLYIFDTIQGVTGGNVSILGGHSVDHS
jgi:hypothetical protein